jgi:lipopolysaccharide export system protein LptA
MLFHFDVPNLRIVCACARGMLIAVAIAAGGEADARRAVQGVPNAMQGFSQNPDQPIHIEAASLDMINKKEQAIFSGGVKVVKGDATMKSRILVAFYDKAGSAPAGSAKAPIKSATPGPGGGSSIHRLEARGDVVVTQKDQVVTGQTAVFDTRTNLITVAGRVVLTQCTNVLRGDRLVVDMTTGDSRLESHSGRVQGLFPQPGQGCGSPIPAQGSASAPPGSNKN